MNKRVVVLGAGYGGLVAALKLAKGTPAGSVDITLVNKYDYHQLVTQLYEPAAAAKRDTEVRIPLKKLLAGKPIRFVQDVVTKIDPKEKVVTLEGGELSYDYLVVALGSETEYFGIPGMKEYGMTLKSVDEARLIRTHIERCFAEYPLDPRPELLTFVVGGAGLTGIELVGEIADWLPRLCEESNIPREQVTLYNVEAMPSILPGFEPDLVAKAEEVLKAKGVIFKVGSPIVQVEPGAVHLKDGGVIQSRTIIWTGGVRGNQIVVDAGFETEPRGRAKVNEYLQAVGYDDVYMAGDCCFVLNEQGRPYPPTAQLAIQMGNSVAHNLAADLQGRPKTPFVPKILGTVASLGGRDAVGKVGNNYKASGRVAYFIKDLSQIRYLAKIGALMK
ncbi:NAD(P)/FAD-dependent oxidoreductase [Kyrpidia spormannii]|uniref:NADH dehydrogenase-like protein YumB n=2 Tax=Kyrpidia spormannii TaxID=2055160 RepID=A0ACA8ZA56_9BACL|nr:NAD(P)/FAD-dependent oxidoreductase [Kyrpidia spormannii]CAB3393300.1 NADH dehydrogenase-like protein YumB [Kyrpidia spormannii]CAB3394220.1 NADH dehydrogenase-like protein YumB [Kyrpidia spormannii]